MNKTQYVERTAQIQEQYPGICAEAELPDTRRAIALSALTALVGEMRLCYVDGCTSASARSAAYALRYRHWLEVRDLDAVKARISSLLRWHAVLRDAPAGLVKVLAAYPMTIRRLECGINAPTIDTGTYSTTEEDVTLVKDKAGDLVFPKAVPEGTETSGTETEDQT